MLRRFLIIPHLMVFLLAAYSGAIAQSGAAPLRHNQAAATALDEEIARSRNERDLAVLRGIRWCVEFSDNDANFEFVFTNYLTMLDELTVEGSNSVIAGIVHDLILKEIGRALPTLAKLFPADASGYENFISILPVAYHHGARVAELRDFAAWRFAGVAHSGNLEDFRRSAKERNYDRLTDLVVGEAFIDMAYRWNCDRDFKLPPNHYRTMLAECAAIPFKASAKNEAAYHDQNYYATHVLLALNHYGQRPASQCATAEGVLSYLFSQYKTVRYETGDLDLLCEYLYCFRQFAPAEADMIREGERYVMSMQRNDGSWGTADDFEGDPYDRLHPTWTAITLLVRVP